jgi:nucleoside-diphosphate kinase
MSIERTYAMIKPDAVKRKLIGKIIDRIEAEGFSIVAMRKHHFSLQEAQGFYAVHAARPFFGELTQFMSSGPIVALVLEREGAIAHWRDTMGATNPANAAPNTLRKLYAASIGENCTHGSDAPETAAQEIGYMFAGVCLV